MLTVGSKQIRSGDTGFAWIGARAGEGRVGSNHYRQAIPEVKLQAKAFDQMKKGLAPFGLSPADRSGLEVKESVEKSPMARLLRTAK